MRLLYQVRRNMTVHNSFSLFSKTLALICATTLLTAPVLSKSALSQSEQKPVEASPPQKSSHADSSTGDEKDSAHEEAIREIDVASLIRESNAKGADMLKHMLEYTYTLKKIRRVLNGDGKPVNERVDTFEAYPVRGQHVLIQMTSNGAPLHSSLIAEERKRAGKNLMYAENEAKKQDGRNEVAPAESRGYLAAGISGIHRSKYASVTIDISEILRSCEFSSPRPDRLGDRDMIALSFRPRPGYNFPTNKKYISKLVGVVWIDAIDHVVARVEAQVAPNPLDYQINRGPVLIYEQARQSSGAWFPTLIRLNTRGDESLANGLNWDVVFELSEFRQFTSKADDVKIKDPDKSKPNN